MHRCCCLGGLPAGKGKGEQLLKQNDNGQVGYCMYLLQSRSYKGKEGLLKLDLSSRPTPFPCLIEREFYHLTSVEHGIYIDMCTYDL